MPAKVSSRRLIRFGEFELDLQGARLFRQGVKVRLRGQLFTVLRFLAEQAGKVVTREELQRQLWPGDIVVNFEVDLNTIMARLREALGDSAQNPRFIETLPRRGYRFLPAVSVSDAPASRIRRQPRVRLAVLPFLNLAGDPAEEYFSDAMTDEIINALCRLAPEDLAVIARTTAMHYKGSQKGVARIGRELGVDYIVEGGIRRRGDKVEMNAQLIQTADQTNILARKYNAVLSEVFNMVSCVASDIAGRIRVSPARIEKPAGLPISRQARRKPTKDMNAYNEYIQGRYHMGKLTAEGFTKAKQHLDRATALDPEFALAHDALAELHWYLGYLGFVPPREAFSAGIVHALRAIELDSGRGEIHALLGEFHKITAYNWPEVNREMALALRLDPTSPLVRLRYAVSALMPHGRLEEAIAEIKTALESDPLSILIQGWLGIMLLLAHQWDLAVDQAHLLIRLDPTFFVGHYILGVAYRGKRMFAQALKAHRKAVEVSGGSPVSTGWLGLTLAVSGKAAEARSLLERLQARAARGYVPPTSFAWIHLGLGEIDTAFEWLNRAVDECDQFMMPIKTYAFFDPLRSDPRFLALLRKMNLEP